MLKRTILLLVGAVLVGCLGSHHGAGAESVRSPSPTSWERTLNTHYTHYGVATIEQVGTRYILRIDCGGVHDIYARGASDVQLGAYLGTPLRAYYVYEMKVNPNIRCIQQPCAPVRERTAMIHHVERLTEADTSKARAERECSPR